MPPTPHVIKRGPRRSHLLHTTTTLVQRITSVRVCTGIRRQSNRTNVVLPPCIVNGIPMRIHTRPRIVVTQVPPSLSPLAPRSLHVHLRLQPSSLRKKPPISRRLNATAVVNLDTINPIVQTRVNGQRMRSRRRGNKGIKETNSRHVLLQSPGTHQSQPTTDGTGRVL